MSMQSHENDFLINPESHQAPTRRKDAAESAGPEALMHGRTDVLTPSAVMHLQKTAGNASVTAALEVQQRSGPVAGTPAPGGIQISSPSDSFEQAAESSADRVMSSSAPSTESAAAAPAAVQREATEGEEEEEAPASAQTYAIQRAESEELPEDEG